MSIPYFSRMTIHFAQRVKLHCSVSQRKQPKYWPLPVPYRLGKLFLVIKILALRSWICSTSAKLNLPSYWRIKKLRRLCSSTQHPFCCRTDGSTQYAPLLSEKRCELQILPHVGFRWLESWPLNHAGVNRMGPQMQNFFDKHGTVI